ncbi:hypothetical protein [Actinomycetospora termitidis]|uniref:Uncharacterized protein n=1 Tax=Actinomycetospora termitidis TaxID=3053470 RepID=A0ABT7M560_9PSEU|nr:hypothetical protein [Actinomycetospora sp. Odt1-22]MDL5155814.1 hypothetical protein [Actinomycetospora sp. Odt1-22]
MKVESLLQREGRGPVERTGPIPLPGRRPRHSAGAGRPAHPAHPDALTEPIAVGGSFPTTGGVGSRAGAAFAVPSGAFPAVVGIDTESGTDPVGPAPAVPRTRDPRPTPATGTPAGPALVRARGARPAPPRRSDEEPPAVRRVPVPDDDVAPDPDETPPRPMRRRSRLRTARRQGRTTVLVVLALVLAALAAAGVAVAAYLASGSGASGVSGGTALAPTTSAVAGSAVTTGLLSPGASGTALLSVTNPNPYKVQVATVAPAGAATASGGVGACATTGVTFTAQTVPDVVLAPAASTTLTLGGAVAMSNASETGCQGATFSVPVTVSVVSAP